MCNMHIYVYTASLSQTRHMERSCSHEVVTKVYASLFVHNPYERETMWGSLPDLSRVGFTMRLENWQCSRRGGGGVERGGDPWVALSRESVPPPRATQGSPPRSTPPPPLREWMGAHPSHETAFTKLPLKA